MVIKASSRVQIDGLLLDLASEQEVVRETAVSRLTVLGARASERLDGLASTPTAAPALRAAALRVLEAIGDLRSLDLILRMLDDPDALVASAAASAARTFLRGPRGDTALDRLTAVAVDSGQPEATRVAAIRALSALDRSTVAPLYQALSKDANAAIAAIAARHGQTVQETGAGWMEAAVEGDLPDDPQAVRRAVSAEGGALPLPLLHKLIERLRKQEGEAPAGRRQEWTAARGAVHVVLANRGSRVALYDLRETLAAARDPLPVDFLVALREIGDASCVEPVAAAYARSTDEWWRRQLAEAFRAIVSRERLTARHAVMKRVAKKHRAILNSEFGIRNSSKSS